MMKPNIPQELLRYYKALLLSGAVLQRPGKDPEPNPGVKDLIDQLHSLLSGGDAEKKNELDTLFNDAMAAPYPDGPIGWWP